MMNKIADRIKKTPKFFWLLALVMLVGIILHTYNFHDWLRFNNDQARDAQIVSNALDGKAPLPILGPKAGGTEFKLGPAFYYFEYASARIFGNSPDKMAYPDLISGILMIPLLFFFLRKYFSQNISLILVFILAVSYFGEHYGRFAWNPNSMPFWSLLFVFSLLEIFKIGGKGKYVWSVVAGIAFGIAIQLHTLLLVILPIYAAVFFGYAIYKRFPIKKFFAIAMLVAFLVNLPQAMAEYQTGGKNVQAFFAAQKIKRSGNSSIFESVGTALACTFQADLQIVSGIGDTDRCTFFQTDDNTLATVAGSLATIIAGMALLILGTVFLWNKLAKETDQDKKTFLLAVLVYGLFYLLMMIPIAHEIENKAMRYYLGTVFVPFVLLGFWFDFLRSSLKKRDGVVVIMGIVAIFAITNAVAIQKDFSIFTSTDKGSNVTIFTLGEGERISNYIDSLAMAKGTAIIDGNSKDMFHFFRPLQFLASEKGLRLERYKSDSYDPSLEVFSVNFGEDKEAGNARQIGRYTVAEQKAGAGIN